VTTTSRPATQLTPSPRRATAGAAVVYQCLNPPCHRWADQFPSLHPVVHAARTANARYVSFENTYMYGDTTGWR
jgi:hypothetical protein